MPEVFVVYYDPKEDIMFQSKLPIENALREKKRVMYAPWFCYMTDEQNTRLPLREAPAIAWRV